jgi:hypothetical protein
LLVFPCPWIVVLLFQFANPGTITAANVDRYLQLYPYDSLLYHPAKCARLLIPAVPRSRYCPYTEMRIARYDHYCPWVAQAIGEKTLRLYVLFLFFNLSTFSYYFVVSAQLLWSHVATVSHKVQWTRSRSHNVLKWLSIVLADQSVVCGICIFYFILSIALLSVLAKQSYLISKNVTSAELARYRVERVGVGQQDSKFHNCYDKGISMNWFDVIFPPFL